MAQCAERSAWKEALRNPVFSLSWGGRNGRRARTRAGGARRIARALGRGFAQYHSQRDCGSGYASVPSAGRPARRTGDLRARVAVARSRQSRAGRRRGRGTVLFRQRQLRGVPFGARAWRLGRTGSQRFGPSPQPFRDRDGASGARQANSAWLPGGYRGFAQWRLDSWPAEKRGHF